VSEAQDSRRPGRRAGESGTREAILGAARSQFAERGFDRTSLRSIAQEAGVDPTLVSHFYGSKQKLFATVVELPFDPAVVIPHLIAGDQDGVGLRLARFLVAVLESDAGRQRLTGMVRAAASEPEASRLVREFISREVLARIAESLDVDAAPLRASLVGSQIVGMVMARYIVKVEPLASRDADEVAELVAPVFQHYLTEPL
jgi:AcrR family transcriptional regulator